MLVPLRDSYMRHAGPARRSRFTGTSAPHPQGQDRTNQRGPCRSTRTASPGRFKYALASAREVTLALIVNTLFVVILSVLGRVVPSPEVPTIFRLFHAEFFDQSKTRLRVTYWALRPQGSDAGCNLCE